VVDLVYAHGITPVLAWGERRGARLVDGLEILVRQGARSFERWTGRAAPIDVMRAAARAD
jgi:shikimate dehydrogenase